MYKPVSQSCTVPISGLFGGIPVLKTDCMNEWRYLKKNIYINIPITNHFKQYVRAFMQSAMFTGRVARQTNRLYVLRMTVKLAHCTVQHRLASSSGYCSRKLKRNLKVVYFLYRPFFYKNVFSELKLDVLNILQDLSPKSLVNGVLDIFWNCFCTYVVKGCLVQHLTQLKYVYLTLEALRGRRGGGMKLIPLRFFRFKLWLLDRLPYALVQLFFVCYKSIDVKKMTS